MTRSISFKPDFKTPAGAQSHADIGRSPAERRAAGGASPSHLHRTCGNCTQWSNSSATGSAVDRESRTTESRARIRGSNVRRLIKRRAILGMAEKMCQENHRWSGTDTTRDFVNVYRAVFNSDPAISFLTQINRSER